MADLTEGDEQFDAFRKLHEMTRKLDTEDAAYVLEEFCTSYYLEDDTAAMALAIARNHMIERTI